MSNSDSQSAAHVRGVRSYHQRAGAIVRLGATVLDGSLAVFLFFVLHRALRLSPVPHAAWVAAVALLAAGLWLLGRVCAGCSPGEGAWRLRAAKSLHASPIRAPLLQPALLSRLDLAAGIFLTTIAIIASAWSMDRAVFKQPLWARADRLELDVFLPDLKSGRWEVLPFFYTLGAWPREYGGKPIFYSLPYEKGPPTRFIGHMSARWEAPGTMVTFEGPKTPKSATSRDVIRGCLLGAEHSWTCLKIREATLLRHLSDVQLRLTGQAGGDTALAMKWQVRWFTVQNPAIAPGEQAQGIYISAVSSEGTQGEERYILITENGTHQAISLSYPQPGSLPATQAREIFVQAIRSLRASDDLSPGRAWADHQLMTIQLQDKLGALLTAAKPPSDSEAANVITRLAQAQALLLAKISVQPAVFDSYFHLGGTALLLNRLARTGARAGQLEGLELSATAKPMVQSAYRYAQDLAPQDSRTTQLQGFWLEVQKL